MIKIFKVIMVAVSITLSGCAIPATIWFSAISAGATAGNQAFQATMTYLYDIQEVSRCVQQDDKTFICRKELMKNEP